MKPLYAFLFQVLLIELAVAMGLGELLAMVWFVRWYAS